MGKYPGEMAQAWMINSMHSYCLETVTAFPSSARNIIIRMYTTHVQSNKMHNFNSVHNIQLRIPSTSSIGQRKKDFRKSRKQHFPACCGIILFMPHIKIQQFSYTHRIDLELFHHYSASGYIFSYVLSSELNFMYSICSILSCSYGGHKYRASLCPQNEPSRRILFLMSNVAIMSSIRETMNLLRAYCKLWKILN